MAHTGRAGFHKGRRKLGSKKENVDLVGIRIGGASDFRIISN